MRWLRLLVFAGLGLGTAWWVTDPADREQIAIALGLSDPRGSGPAMWGPTLNDPWPNDGMTEMPMVVRPHFQELCYRETVSAALTWLHGWPAHPADGSDHRLAAKWVAEVDGRPREFRLMLIGL